MTVGGFVVARDVHVIGSHLIVVNHHARCSVPEAHGPAVGLALVAVVIHNDRVPKSAFRLTALSLSHTGRIDQQVIRAALNLDLSRRDRAVAGLKEIAELHGQPKRISAPVRTR